MRYVQTLLVLAMTALPLAAGSQNRQQKKDGVLTGETAPTFKLDYVREEKLFDLAEKLGKRPVVLVFGSYT